jgi:hypothetical protein
MIDRAELTRLLEAECDRNTKAVLDILSRYKTQEAIDEAAKVILGGAVAFADMFGLDVEGFVKHMRATRGPPRGRLVAVDPTKRGRT